MHLRALNRPVFCQSGPVAPLRASSVVTKAANGNSDRAETLEGTKSAFLAAAVAFAISAQPAAALADELASASAKELPETVYFGNGCFWGRQKSFVDAERKLGRMDAKEVTSIVGYAAGTKAGPGNKVCYYYGDPRAVYEGLGHAEVVQVGLSKQDAEKATREFKVFAEEYFRQFKKTPSGMMRLDPQDTGPGYRNVVGLPGGVNSPLFSILKEANVNGMELRDGKGNEYEGNRPREDDLMNVVWVVDSEKLPFYQAEQYHQFHSGIGEPFPREYTQELKAGVTQAGRIGPTGCTELPFPPFQF